MSTLRTVRIAKTPVEAKLLAALLRAEGIEAVVDGDGLADEVAVSRRLLNTLCTEVKVEERDLARAREILQAARDGVDDAELERQALEADSAPEPDEGDQRFGSPSPRSQDGSAT